MSLKEELAQRVEEAVAAETGDVRARKQEEVYNQMKQEVVEGYATARTRLEELEELEAEKNAPAADPGSEAPAVEENGNG